MRCGAGEICVCDFYRDWVVSWPVGPDEDNLAQLHRRRGLALRLPGGDPEHPGDRRYHRPTTGLRAAGFREGFGRGGADALRRLWLACPDAREAIELIATDYTSSLTEGLLTA